MKKTTMFTLIIVNAFCYVCYLTLAYLHYTYYNAMQEAFQLTNTEIGVIGTFCGILCSIGFFVGGFLSDIFSAKKMLIFGHLFSAAITFIFIGLPSYTVVFIVMATSAFLVNGILWNGSAKMVRQFSTPQNEAKMFGLYLCFQGLGGTIFGLLGAYFISNMGSVSGLKMIFSVIVVYLIFAALVTFFLYKEQADGRSEVAESEKFKFSYIGEILKNSKFWLLSFSGALLYPICLAMSYFAPLLHTNYGVSLGLVSVVGSFRLYMARIICAPIGGVLVQKTDSIIIMRVVIATALICSVLIVVMPMNSTMLIPAVLVLLAYAIAFNTSTPTWYTPISEIGIPEKMKGTAIGLYSSIMFHSDIYLYLGAGIILDSYEPQVAYRIIYTVTGLFFLIGLILLTILGRKIKAEKLKAASASALA